ncbi:MAG: Uma2 family endonuclease [Acidobacteria bacterium]|nr:Uma2 family endonuclease [Acidobacteriota bacterium]MBI3655889.1 Uma2 family endonuclease [Acidobacteriota bacterium]
MTTKANATVDELYKVAGQGKAEIVGGELIVMSPTGGRPGRAAIRIGARLSQHEEQHGGGYAFGDNVGFIVNLPNRNSFSPDAAWYTGKVEGMDFLQGAPVFAAEIRSKRDYGPNAEREISGKRADYFAAGTQVVWDVDLLSPEVVKVYHATDPENPTIYRRGDLADAEPAVPGWRMPVDELFA